MSDSGNSSKFDVSSMLLISMEMAAGLSLWKEGKCETLVYLKPFSKCILLKRIKDNPMKATWLGFCWGCDCRLYLLYDLAITHASPEEQNTYLMCSQSTGSKKAWLFISSMLTAPTRFSASLQYLKWIHVVGAPKPLFDKRKSIVLK